LGNSEDAELTLKLIVAAEADEPIVVPAESESPNPGDETTPPETETPGTSTPAPETETPDSSTAEPEEEETTTPADGSENDEPAATEEPANDGLDDVKPDEEDKTQKDERDLDDEPTGNRHPWNWIPWGVLAGLLFLFWFLILLWRRITIDGYLYDETGKPMEGYQLVLEQSGLHKTKESEVDEEGYFKIRRIPLGKKSLVLEDEDGNELARNELKLKRKGKLRIDDFLQIQEKTEDDGKKIYTEFDMRYRITGFEIYLHRNPSTRMEIEFDRWIARTWFKKTYTPDEDEKKQTSAGAGMR
jgi:hypothetical protein